MCAGFVRFPLLERNVSRLGKAFRMRLPDMVGGQVSRPRRHFTALLPMVCGKTGPVTKSKSPLLFGRVLRLLNLSTELEEALVGCGSGLHGAEAEKTKCKPLMSSSGPKVRLQPSNLDVLVLA
jgi:hypothetical protein